MRSFERAGIVDLVFPSTPVAPAGWWEMPLAVLGALMVAGGILLLIRCYNRRDAAGCAFVSLSRRLGLCRRERRVVRRLAERSGVAPVALLLSGSALRRAVAEAEEAG
jgi:hypothetical protein